MTIKKRLDNEINIEITKFYLNVMDDSAPEIKKIFNLCMNKMGELQNSVDFMKQNIQQLTDQRDDVLKQFESLVDEKINIENDLYSKFLLVLNEKKQKIRELASDLEDQDRNQLSKRNYDNDGPKANEEKSDGDDVEEKKQPVKTKGRKSKKANDSLYLSFNNDKEKEDNEPKAKKLSLSEKRKLRNKTAAQKITDDDSEQNEDHDEDKKCKETTRSHSMIKRTKGSHNSTTSNQNENANSSNYSLNRSTHDLDELLDKI